MAKVDERRRHRILNGNMWTVIITICAPLFIYNFFNSFYSLIDAVFANAISTGAVSSVAALGQIKNLLSSFAAGIAGGGAILVARRFGAGEFDEARKYANVLVSIIIVLVIILAVVLLPLAYPICRISGISEAQAAASTGYFMIQIAELMVIAFNNVFIALQKSKGNTKSIFYLNILGMIIKLLLNVLFIYGFKVDNIIWIGVATLLSQFTLFIILGSIMIRRNNIFRVSLKELSLSWKYVKPILAISIPIFVGKFVFSFGKVAVNSIFGTQYLNILKSGIDITDAAALQAAEESAGLVVGALAVSNNINGLATTPINSFEEGESTIVSQNLGNKNLRRAIECFFKTLVITSILGIIGWILVRIVFQEALIGLFSTNDNPALAEQFMGYVRQIHKYDSLSVPSLAINAAVLGVLYGFGKTKLAAFINIARAFIFRIPVLVILLFCFPELGVDCAGLSMGISNICIATMSVICLIVFLIQIKKNGYQGMSLSKIEE